MSELAKFTERELIAEIERKRFVAARETLKVRIRQRIQDCTYDLHAIDGASDDEIKNFFRVYHGAPARLVAVDPEHGVQVLT